MIRTECIVRAEDYPERYFPLLQEGRVYDSSCSPAARVLFIERDGGYFLKRAPKGTLEKEARMARYFHSMGLGVPVLDYYSAEWDWLLTARAEGEDCTHAMYLENPTRLCDTLACNLRALHERAAADCPIRDRMTEYVATAERHFYAGEYDLSYFTADYGEATPAELIRIIREATPYFQNDVLLHGDYCLPNILLKDWRLSAFIDVGNGGIGDRHVDLYWGAWTLRFNLKTDAYRARFFDAYGREKMDSDLLRAIAAAEVFG